MSVGFWQLLLVIFIAFVLFGAGRIPKIMEDVAKGIKAFKKGMEEKEESSHKDDSPSS
jgi:sec-independent protein translocase protein TatA